MASIAGIASRRITNSRHVDRAWRAHAAMLLTQSRRVSTYSSGRSPCIRTEFVASRKSTRGLRFLVGTRHPGAGVLMVVDEDHGPFGGDIVTVGTGKLYAGADKPGGVGPSSAVRNIRAGRPGFGNASGQHEEYFLLT